MEHNRPLYDEVKRGEIYYISADEESEFVGSEQHNTNDRPGIIVSNDIGNMHSGIVEVVYLTTAPKKPLPTHVDIYTTPKQSIALCEQICTVSKFRLRKYVNQCSEREMEDIDNALIISLQLSKAKGVGKYMEKWDKYLKEQESDIAEAINIAKESEPMVEYVTYDAQLEKLQTVSEMYKKFYDDMHELLILAMGGK